MTASPSLRPGTWIGDPDDPTHALKPNADGSINVVGGGGGGGVETDIVAVGGNAVTTSVPVGIADGADIALGAVADAAATAGGSGTVSAKLRRISTQLPAALGQTTASASLPVVMASDFGQIGVAYGGVKVAVTRPNNTTPYDAGDVVGGAFEFTNMGPSGGRIMLTSSEFEWDVSAIPSGATSFFLALYNVTPPSAYADGATWDLASGDRASFMGILQLGTPVDLGSTCYVSQDIINKQRKLAGTSIFAYCVTVGGYTPTAQTVQQFTLHSVGLGL